MMSNTVQGPAPLCEHCAENPTSRSRRRFYRFCSDACRRKSWRARYKRAHGVGYDTAYKRAEATP